MVPFTYVGMLSSSYGHNIIPTRARRYVANGLHVEAVEVLLLMTDDRLKVLSG